MGNYLNTIRTTEGKYVTQVRSNTNGVEVTLYETPEYYTYYMASADAKCWKEFHMNETPKAESADNEYTINEDDKVYEGGSLLNTRKVCATVAKAEGFRIEPLTGRLAEFNGFRLHIYTPTKIWRKFDIIKLERNDG